MTDLLLPHDIDESVRANTAYRRVLYTDNRRGENGITQLVAMAIGYDDDGQHGNTAIGWEVHQHTAQFFVLIEGTAMLYMNSTSSDKSNARRQIVGAGSKWMVPPGTWHDVDAKDCGSGRFKVLTVYFPPQHRDGTVHLTRKLAELDYNDKWLI